MPVRLKAWAMPDPGAIIPPMKVAARVRAAPMSDASTTFPGRILYMYRPTNKAMGIVQAMVNVPQYEPGTRRTAPVSFAWPSFQSSGLAHLSGKDSPKTMVFLSEFQRRVEPLGICRIVASLASTVAV